MTMNQMQQPTDLSKDSESTTSRHKLVIVSNRLPIVLQKNKKKQWTVEAGSGGLVTALAPVLRDRGGTWVGWPGTDDADVENVNPVLEKHNESIGYALNPVHMDPASIENYYKGFSNETLWPLFHDLIDHCQFKPEYWEAYQQVNKKFAQVVKDTISENDFIWVHDYHLITMISFLREMGVNNKVGFFLHIPFPPTDIYTRLPQRVEILDSLLKYDLIGFQAPRDRRNFITSVRTLVDKPRIEGKGQVINILRKSRVMRAGVFPISIDFNEFANKAKSQEVQDASWYLHEQYPGQQIILGVDRLDYTKGIPERLRAFRFALRTYLELRGKVCFIQVVVPSRRDIHKYDSLKTEIERLVGDINGEYSHAGWVPIHYMYRSLPRAELLSYYRAAEVAIVSPLKDGMNLVAKEYCACRVEGNGVLILSEFAGTAAQMKTGAILVNPHDTVACAEAIYMAIHMDEKDRKIRMQKLRRNIRRFDIFWWVDSFLKSAFSRNLGSFQLVADYKPLTDGE